MSGHKHIPSIPDPKINSLKLNLEVSLEYGIDLHARVIRLYGEVCEYWWDVLDTGLTQMERDNARKTVILRMNSEGGLCYQAQAIIGRIRASSCHIITEGYGPIMSAATLIHAAGDKKRMSRFATYMYHQATFSSLESITTSDLKDLAVQTEKERLQWCEFMAELTAQPVEFWEVHSRRKDSYFKPEQLMELGIIDEVF